MDVNCIIIIIIILKMNEFSTGISIMYHEIADKLVIYEIKSIAITYILLYN